MASCKCLASQNLVPVRTCHHRVHPMPNGELVTSAHWCPLIVHKQASDLSELQCHCEYFETSGTYFETSGASGNYPSTREEIPLLTAQHIPMPWLRAFIWLPLSKVISAAEGTLLAGCGSQWETREEYSSCAHFFFLLPDPKWWKAHKIFSECSQFSILVTCRI